MPETALIKKICAKKVSKELIADQIIKKQYLLPEIFEGMQEKSADIKYGCDKILRILSEKKPSMLYPQIDYFINNLKSSNNIFKWSSIIILANIAAVDEENKIDEIIDEYLHPIEGPVLISAANTIAGAAKIALSKPCLAEKIASALLKTSNGKYATSECKNIAAGETIDAFEKIYELVEDKQALIKFAEGQINNSRYAVHKKAVKFLKKRKPLATAEIL